MLFLASVLNPWAAEMFVVIAGVPLNIFLLCRQQSKRKNIKLNQKITKAFACKQIPSPYFKLSEMQVFKSVFSRWRALKPWPLVFLT